MDLKLGLNRTVQPGEKKTLSATAAAGMEDAILRGILEQTASLAGEGADSWTELALKEGLSPAIRAQLLEAGMEEKRGEHAYDLGQYAKRLALCRVRAAA